MSHRQSNCIDPCLDSDGPAAVNQQAEKVLSPQFGTGVDQVWQKFAVDAFS